MPTAVLFAPPPPPGTAAPSLVGGLTPLDRQLRQVRQAGITRVLVVGNRALDVATLNDDVLVIDAGVVLDDRIVRAMAAATAPAVAIWPATGAAGTERIDMHAAAAGIALYPAALVRDTAATLGEWDLAPTLLRAALAAGATRVDLAALATFDADLGRAVPLVWARPDDADSASSATAALLGAARPGCRDGVARWLHARLEEPVVRFLLPTVPADAVMATGAAVAVGAGIAFASGWLWAGLLLALLCGPIAGVGAMVARIRVERLRLGGAFVDLAPYAWFAAAAAHFAATGTVWALPVAALLMCFMLAERLQRGFFRRLTGRSLDLAGPFEQRLALVAARRDPLLWTWLPFAAFGHWTAGFAVLAGYATASFFVAQWRSFVRLGERGLSAR